MNEHERAEGQAVSTNASGSANAVAQEIGASLAKARAAQGLSIHDVGARLKVPAQKVDAIESGNVDALPDLTFAKGLMRAYARLLQVDIDALLARFHAQAAPPAPEVAIRRQGSLNASFDDRRRFRSSGTSGTGGRWVWLALVAVVVCAGALFGVDHVKQWLDAREQQFTQSGAETAVETESGTSGTVTAVLPHVMGGAASEAPGAMTGAEGATAGGTASASATLATPLAPVTGAPVASNESAATAAAAAPAAAAATAASASGELQLRFSAPTWYEVRDASGKVVLGGTAKEGDEVAGGGTAPYKVVIGNVKGVAAMTRNGEPVDLQAANRNNVARLTLP